MCFVSFCIALPQVDAFPALFETSRNVHSWLAARSVLGAVGVGFLRRSALLVARPPRVTENSKNW